MRTIYFLLCFPLLLFFASNILAQENTLPNVWHTQPFQPPYYDFHFDTFGVEKEQANLERDLWNPNASKSINNFYAAGGTLKNEGHHLAINRFWVNTDTYKNKWNIDAYDFSINELTLQVGKKSLGNITGKERTFGTDSVVGSLSLSEKSLTADGFTLSKFEAPPEYVTPEHFSVVNIGTIYQADMSGGTLYNAGSMGTLNYSGGNYKDQGGSVDHLNFVGNGNGLVNYTVTAFLNENSQLDFEGMSVNKSIDFTNGNIVLDMTDVIGAISENPTSRMRTIQDAKYWSTLLYGEFGSEAFELDTLVTNIFGAEADYSKDALNIDVMVGDNDESFAFIASGKVQEGWEVRTSSTPEPATLAMLGAGLVGLGWITRRRKR